MNIFQYFLLGFLIICAISVSLSKNLLRSILIYMSYSLIMSILWITLESPDLAITEAAVGAGITSVLFFVTLKKIHAIGEIDKEDYGPYVEGDPGKKYGVIEETVASRKKESENGGVNHE